MFDLDLSLRSGIVESLSDAGSRVFEKILLSILRLRRAAVIMAAEGDWEVDALGVSNSLNSFGKKTSTYFCFISGAKSLKLMPC